MAITLDKALTMHIKVYNGVNANGTDKFQTKSLNDINPEISDDDFVKAARAVSTLISKTLHSFSRVDTTELDEAPKA